MLHILTPKDRSVLEQGLAIAKNVIEDAFKDLTEAERTQLLRLVQKALPIDGVEQIWR